MTGWRITTSLGGALLACALVLCAAGTASPLGDGAVGPLVPPVAGERWSGEWELRGQVEEAGATITLGTLRLELQAAGASETAARTEAASYLWVSGCEITPYPIYRGSWSEPAGTRVIACWFLKRPDVWLLDGVYIRADGSHGLLRLNMKPGRTDRFNGVYSLPRTDLPVGDVQPELTLALAAGPLDAPTCAGKEATIWPGDRGRPMPPGTPILGTDGDDVIVGSAGADVIRAGAGNDVICARGGADRIWGGAGDDVIRGGRGRDVIRGGKGRDSADGGKGRDRCAQVVRRKSCELR